MAALFVPGVRPVVSVNVSAIAENARATGVRYLLLRGGSAPPALAPETRTRLQDDLRRGYWVVTPERQIEIDGRPRSAWWRIDPRTGETTAVNDDGLHGEYTVVHARQSEEGTYVTYQTYLKSFEAGPVLIEEGQGFVAGSQKLATLLCRALAYGDAVILGTPDFPWTTYVIGCPI